MSDESARQVAAQFADALHEHMLHYGRSLHVRHGLPDTPDDFAREVTWALVNALAASLGTLNRESSAADDVPPENDGSYAHLIGCSRCGALHGNGAEPPVGWVPLMDQTPAIWGVLCPECRVTVGDDVVQLVAARPLLRAAPETSDTEE